MPWGSCQLRICASSLHADGVLRFLAISDAECGKDFSHDLENFSEPAAVRLKSSLSLRQFLTVDGRWEDTASYARYGVYDEYGLGCRVQGLGFWYVVYDEHARPPACGRMNVDDRVNQLQPLCKRR